MVGNSNSTDPCPVQPIHFRTHVPSVKSFQHCSKKVDRNPSGRDIYTNQFETLPWAWLGKPWSVRPWLPHLHRKLSQKDRRRIALKSAQKKFKMVKRTISKKTGKLSVPKAQVVLYLIAISIGVESSLMPITLPMNLCPRSGSDGMKRSAEYPPQFGHKVASLHEKTMV